MKYLIDGKHIYAQKINGALWFHVDGKTYKHVDESQIASASSAEVNVDFIKAPMPGKIIKVSVKSDSQVKTGDVLVIMEAMKMEYKLKAGRDGIVVIHCKEDDAVSLGQDLVTFNEDN